MSASHKLPKPGKKLPKKASHKGYDAPKLTPTEQEVYELIRTEYLDAKAISIRRETSVRASNQILQKLKKKGVLTKDGSIASRYTPPVRIPRTKKSCVVTKLWRYHKLHFVIKPYYLMPRYHKIRKEKGNYGINWRDWVMKLHVDMIELQLRSGRDFADIDKWTTTRKAQDSFNRAVFELQQKYGFEVFKDGKANIRLVDQHLARNPSETANAYKNDYLKVTGLDGKVFFLIDKSKGKEHEYVHPDNALSDSEIIEPYLNDWLLNQPSTSTQIMGMLREVLKVQKHSAEINRETAAGLNSITQLILKDKPDSGRSPVLSKEDASYIG